MSKKPIYTDTVNVRVTHDEDKIIARLLKKLKVSEPATVIDRSDVVRYAIHALAEREGVK